MTDRPILGPNWRDFVEQIDNRWEARTAPQAPTLPAALADAFNTSSLCVFLVSCAVIDDHLCEMFQEAHSIGLGREDFERETRVLRAGPFPNIAGLYHDNDGKTRRDKIDSFICLYQTSILAEKLLGPVAVALIHARGKLGGPITRSGRSATTAHHLIASMQASLSSLPWLFKGKTDWNEREWEEALSMGALTVHLAEPASLDEARRRFRQRLNSRKVATLGEKS